MTTKTVGTVILSGLFLAGCGGETKPAATNAAATNAKPPATAPATPTTVTTPSGTGSVGSLPADFPKDVPVYAGAAVSSGATTGAGAGAMFTTADAPEKVVAFYKEELPKQGWTNVQAVSAAGMNSVSGKKEKRMLGISLTKAADGKTTISVGVTTVP